MAEPRTEEEQIEALTQWLKTNGPGIVAGVVIGLAVLGGWQWWSRYQNSQAEIASTYYNAMLAAINAADRPKARGQAAVLVDEFADSSYGALAGLTLAKLAVEDGDNSSASEHLNGVLTHSDNDELTTIARLRLVRVLLAEQRFDEALSQLDQVQNKKFNAEQEELRGDLHLAQQQPDQARTAYEAARAALGESGGGSLLQLKLENLPAATP